MEETLVRNLSDHSGNNLLHAMTIFGHLIPLIWLLTTHKILVDALYDENKYGLTPVVCSIKVSIHSKLAKIVFYAGKCKMCSIFAYLIL